MAQPNAALFEAATKLVIDNFEGGYFHPYQYKDGRLNPNSKSFDFMSKSGETLYGLDRHAGHSLFYTTPRISSNRDIDIANKKFYKYKNNDSANFWQYLDKANAANLWTWNSQPPGKDADALKTLASAIIYPAFLSYAKKYLSEAAQNIVFNYPPLLFHFIYATWNGPGFFERWSKKLDADINKGINNPASLLELQLMYRATATSKTDLGAAKMKKLFASPTFITALLKKKSNAVFLAPLIFIGAGLLYYYSKK